MTSAGGRRYGAGRPVGTGKWHEPTKPMRIPFGAVAQVEALLAEYMHRKVAAAALQTYKESSKKGDVHGDTPTAETVAEILSGSTL